MNVRRLFIACLGAAALASCAPSAISAEPEPMNPPSSSNVEIRLARGACFGFCPVYTVSINGAGEVRYEGRNFVNVVGQRTATIPAENVARLLARFEEVGFDNLDDAYRANVSDLPSYTVSITRDGRTKTVVDYGGVQAGMPRTIRDLQDEIDRVAGTAQWVLRDGQPVRNRPQP